MKKRLKKIILAIVSLALHLAAIGLIIYLVWPIAKWYLDKIPARGVDLYLSASYLSHLLKNFAFRFNGWKEFWFSGVPYGRDYPLFYFYLMIPFAKHFGLIRGIQMFAVTSLFVFTVFSYFLYHQLSQNRILAIVLTLATLFSANIYRALVWAGGIPFWTTQAFFPIVIFLIVKYCQNQDNRWFYLAIMIAGLGIMGHPQNFLNVIIPSAFLLLLFWRPGKQKVAFKKRILDMVKFGGLSYLIGLPLISEWLPLTNLFATLVALLSIVFPQQPSASEGSSATAPGGLRDIEAWTRAQFNFVWSDTHQLLWYLLVVGFALFLGSLILRKKRLKGMVSFLPFGLTVGLVIGSVFLYSRGIDPYVLGWYKAFWPVVASVSTLTAFLWGETRQVFTEREFWQKKAAKIVRWAGIVVVNLALIGVGYYFLLPGAKNTIERLEKLDQFSSAYPEILNVETKQEDWLTLKDKLKPKLMAEDPHDYRLYVIDATVNIWWGSLQDVPLTRGYIDPPLTFAERWGLFWLDSALGPTTAGPKSSLIEDWDTPEEVADNNVYFLLDWYATKYLEGNHLSAANSRFASNITTEKFIEAEEKIETQGGIVNRYLSNEAWSDEVQQSLNFYRVKSDLVSPLLMATDATPILHIGGEDGYDTLTRFLAEVNLGPRKVILARGPKFIDKVSFSDLTNFEAVILYKYDYASYDKAWKLVSRYVEEGGKVFVDTGPEVKESDTTKLPTRFPSELPGIFPIKRTVREDLGQSWEPEAASVAMTEGVNFDKFSPLIFDDDVWNISHPISDDDLREDAQVILRHKGIPVVVEGEFGKGKVIWSGFNLPYHTVRDYNPEEAKFFKNLLSELVSLEEKPVLSKGSFISPRERVIEVDGAKGIIFKEQAFNGWKAKLDGRKLKIYKVGPTSPGFVYVRLPEQASGEVKFAYSGALSAKVNSAISALVIIFILDYLLGGKILLALIRRLSARPKKHVGKWWEKEDEY